MKGKTPLANSPAAKAAFNWEQKVKSNPGQFCKAVKLAVERAENDRAKMGSRGFRWEYRPELADPVLKFAGLLRLTKGRWHGVPLVLMDWQAWFLVQIFGWVEKKTGLRRFRSIDLQVARKNAKTTLQVVIILWCIIAEERGGNWYCGGNTEKQARILYNTVRETILLTPGLTRHLIPNKSMIEAPERGSFIEALPGNPQTLDGFDASGAVVDEIGTAPDSGLWDVLAGGMAAREQPLLIGISSASTLRTSFGNDQRIYTRKVLDGIVKDERHLGITFELDPEDDAHDRKTWVKANPALGTTIRLEELESEYNRAALTPARLSGFIAKRLNTYSSQVADWIPLASWISCIKPRPEIPAGAAVVVGADLSKTGDFTALAFVYPDHGPWVEFAFFLPSKGFEKRAEFENQSFGTWRAQGFLQTLGESTIDLEALAEFVAVKTEGRPVSIFGDPYGSRLFQKALEAKGLPWVGFGQSMNVLSEPTFTLEQAVVAGKIAIEQNPVFLWMAQNARAWYDANGRIKIQKPRDRRMNIDGLIALIMAYAKAVSEEGAPKASEFWEPFAL